MDKSLLKPVSGTRDFGPLQVRRRQYIFRTIREVFELYGFGPIETPAMERLEVLTGKYGDEGDQLVFKVLNSGDYLSEVPTGTPTEAAKLLPHIAEKALRYDLTVPFARFVVGNRNEVALPFKRYQIQPVWRADRPQKGRYREFWQCDVDVVGTDSLLCEAELAQIYDLALSRLGLRDFTLKLNHRKLLQAVAEAVGAPEKLTDICTAIDKLDKIGREKVEAELRNRGLTEPQIRTLSKLFEVGGSTIADKLAQLKPWLQNSPSWPKAEADLLLLVSLLQAAPLQHAKLELDVTLARGLNYYTGCIFEVKANGVEMGSIGGGGRYDDLAGIFGWEGLTGVGVSFGADRIYDVLETLGLFDHLPETGTQLLLANFGGAALLHSTLVAQQLRAEGVSCEVYPDEKKITKQFEYADKRNIPFVLVIGPDDITGGLYPLKNLTTGEQTKLNLHFVVKAVLGR
jgi:histidyl-tRNA synthetase